MRSSQKSHRKFPRITKALRFFVYTNCIYNKILMFRGSYILKAIQSIMSFNRWVGIHIMTDRYANPGERRDRYNNRQKDEWIDGRTDGRTYSTSFPLQVLANTMKECEPQYKKLEWVFEWMEIVAKTYPLQYSIVVVTLYYNFGSSYTENNRKLNWRNMVISKIWH